MAKPALGKGLGQLMVGQPAGSGKPVPAEAAPGGKVTPVDFGRGMSTLIGAGAAEKAASRPGFVLPPWFFFAADILLLGYTVVVCLDAGHPMQTGEVLFACVSITLGALLAIMGVLRATPADSP